jgi:hypothetical protein
LSATRYVVGNLKTARAFALDNHVAVPRAQFDLPNMAAGGIDFSAIRVARFRQLRASHRDTYLHRWMRTVVGAGSKSGWSM